MANTQDEENRKTKKIIERQRKEHERNAARAREATERQLESMKTPQKKEAGCLLIVIGVVGLGATLISAFKFFA